MNTKKSADPVTPDDEQVLWDTGVINMTTARGLLNAVFFYNGKLFALRGGSEHHSLLESQFQIIVVGGKEKLQFTERGSKNCQGGLNQRHFTPKVVLQDADETNDRCVVKIYKKYLSLICKGGNFYKRPNDFSTTLSFSRQNIGINTLGNYMAKIFEQAGIDMDGRRITNHSGRVTCCTTLYAAGFDEQEITARSGHRSNAVQTYKRPSAELRKRVSDSLQPPRPTKAAKSCTIVRPSESDDSNYPSTSRSSLATVATSAPVATPAAPATPATPATCTTAAPPVAENTLHISVPNSIKTVIVTKGDRSFTVSF